MNEPTLDDFAQDTAHDILKQYASDCLNRHGLRHAIARLARQGTEIAVCLHKTQQQERAD